MKLKIVKFKSVKSTNDTAIKLIKSDKYLLGLVSTDAQTKGRGTMGKKWISHKGNIFISIFFKVNLIKIKIENYLIINAKIIKKILHEYTKKIIKIKKPNDLVIDGKKICGILQEVISHNRDKYLITGIGINTKISPSDENFECTSLKINSKKNINNKIIINKIKRNYDKLIYDLNNHNSLYVKKKYK
jgi:BirA family transcriptional regulator, biotin operon repressor / biotin---[acetyl-CoA-carboxylase] ligase|tara:strand:- start:538 stop:1101 length:564 start_codon:yes stop_codon:yes gene_type:complete